MALNIKLLWLGVASLIVVASYLGFSVVHKNRDLELHRTIAFAKCVQEVRKLEPLDEKVLESRRGLVGSRPTTKIDVEWALIALSDFNDYKAVCRYIAPKISADLIEKNAESRRKMMEKVK